MKWRLLIVGLLIVAGISSGTLVASADHVDPFLCPIVGDGVNNADDNNGDNGVSTIGGPDGTPAGISFLPGNNQAGAKSNPNAHNTLNPGNPDAGPGGNPDFSPIWPGEPH